MGKKLSSFVITHPVAAAARKIEHAILIGENSSSKWKKTGCALSSRTISLTAFPTFLLLELAFKRIPRLVKSIGNKKKFIKKSDKVGKYLLAFLCFPMGIRFPDGVSGFFLKRSLDKPAVLPFGVEKQYGKTVDQILYPKDKEELQEIIRRAKRDGKQVSIIGSGMSQGTQTVPKNAYQVVVNLKFLNTITFSDNKEQVTVQSGATWEHLQIQLDRQGKSAIVKQASDIFSIGGSIGINCHGWAHEVGSLAPTVESLEIIDAEGNLRILTPKDELFGCMFGTLGYFGVVVSATLKVVDNETLISSTEEIEIDQFKEYYNTQIKGKGFPLFKGRLVLDSLKGNPLRKVCMVRYEKDPEVQKSPVINDGYIPEPNKGTRMQRITLGLLSRLSDLSTKRMIHLFWQSERAHMLKGKKLTRNEALHPPINAFKMLHESNLHAQWLQEYFIKEDNLAEFLRFLGQELKTNKVRMINATIRPVPQDKISILPYAEQNRYAVVICFAQRKTDKAMVKTKSWIEKVNRYLIEHGDRYYQAYMPYATSEEFEKCYGKESLEKLRQLKEKYDPGHVFGNTHTAKYFEGSSE